MTQISFHGLDAQQKKLMVELAFGNNGTCGSVSGGMCGEIYVFDQGENIFHRYESKRAGTAWALPLGSSRTFFASRIATVYSGGGLGRHICL